MARYATVVCDRRTWGESVLMVSSIMKSQATWCFGSKVDYRTVLFSIFIYSGPMGKNSSRARHSGETVVSRASVHRSGSDMVMQRRVGACPPSVHHRKAKSVKGPGRRMRLRLEESSAFCTPVHKFKKGD